jgi:AraC-like DNA-binding protein
MVKSEVGKPRGILNPNAGGKEFRHSRLAPSQDLGFFVAHYWIVAWDLRSQAPHLAETLPHPSVHLVLEKDNSKIVGVMTGKFSRLLEDQGLVFGIKFRPGAFYPFVKSPVSKYTDRLVSLQEVFDVDSKALEAAILPLDEEGKMVERAEDFLRERLPEPDEKVALINRIVEEVIADREIVKVDGLVNRFRINKRNLERLFNRYVGVSPKWVIKRYRLHEAVEQMAEGKVVEWPKLALDLGYFDQAHFIKDFKAIVGKSPTEYARNCRRG